MTLARRFNIPLVEDLGSGYVRTPEREGNSGALRDEPEVRASIAAGADVVMFSGDKLLGGPQAGIIIGTEAPLQSIRRHPLMRALRVDKMTYAALEGTLEAYAGGRAVREIPVARMIAMDPAEIEARARALASALPSHVETSILPGDSTIGGGSAPGSTLATKLLSIAHPRMRSDALLAALRQHTPPVIARIESDRVVLDLRTVAPEDDETIANALRQAADGT